MAYAYLTLDALTRHWLAYSLESLSARACGYGFGCVYVRGCDCLRACAPSGCSWETKRKVVRCLESPFTRGPVEKASRCFRAHGKDILPTAKLGAFMDKLSGMLAKTCSVFVVSLENQHCGRNVEPRSHACPGCRGTPAAGSSNGESDKASARSKLRAVRFRRHSCMRVLLKSMSMQMAVGLASQSKANQWRAWQQRKIPSTCTIGDSVVPSEVSKGWLASVLLSRLILAGLMTKWL